MLSSGVIMWSYYAMLSCGMITPQSFIIPENLTRSEQGGYFSKMRKMMLLKIPWDFLET
jgi:hypothetical protein